MFNNKIISEYIGFISPFKSLLFSNLLLCVCLGCISSVIGMKLNNFNVPLSTIGQVMVWHNVGMVVGAIYVFKFLNHFGRIRAFAVCVLFAALFAIIHAFIFNVFTWGVLRFLFGFFEIIALACLESWFNLRTDNKNRGFIMSIYMLSAFFGQSIGQFFLRLPDESGYVIFSILALFCVFAAFPILNEKISTVTMEESKKISFREFFKRAPVGIFSCFIYGSLSGLFYALATVYILKIGLTKHEASLFMSCVFLGGMFFQIPIGKLSDKIDRRLVMILNSIFIVILSLSANWFLLKGGLYISIYSILIGAVVFSLYPVGVAFANDRAKQDEMTSASGILVFSLGTGTVISPLVASSLMEQYGADYFMKVICFFASFLLIVATSSFVKYKIKKRIVRKRQFLEQINRAA